MFSASSRLFDLNGKFKMVTAPTLCADVRRFSQLNNADRFSVHTGHHDRAATRGSLRLTKRHVHVRPYPLFPESRTKYSEAYKVAQHFYSFVGVLRFFSGQDRDLACLPVQDTVVDRRS